MKEAPNIGNHFKTAHPPKIQLKKPCISKIIFLCEVYDNNIAKAFIERNGHTMAVDVLRAP